MQRLKEIVLHPIDNVKWWYWLTMKNTICKWRGHKRTNISDILGCCDRCYESVDTVQSEIFRSAMERAWGDAEKNLKQVEPS